MSSTGKRYKAEQIVNMLREIDVKTSNGKTIPEACKQAGIILHHYQYDTCWNLGDKHEDLYRVICAGNG